jgi:hypothetical protein
MSRIVLLCALVVTIAVAGSIATTSAHAGREPKLDPPTLLWKSYPLEPRAKAPAKAESQPKAAKPPEQRPKAFVPPVPRPKAATPPEPRPKAAAPTDPRRRTASYQISTEQTGSPRVMLFTVFLAGLLVVGTVMLVGQKFAPIRDRRRRRSREAPVRGPAGDLLEALQPKPQAEPLPQPKPLPKLVAAKTVAPTRNRIVTKKPTEHEPQPSREPTPLPAFRKAPIVARCEIKLWRGFAKSHLYAAATDSDDEPIISFSPYFRVLEDDRSSSQGLQALAALVEELEQDGWTVVSDGPAWYQHRLERLEGS